MTPRVGQVYRCDSSPFVWYYLVTHIDRRHDEGLFDADVMVEIHQIVGINIKYINHYWLLAYPDSLARAPYTFIS